MTLDFTQVNTVLLLGAGGWLWRQNGRVEALYQVLVGINGKSGALEELKLLNERSRTLDIALASLTVSLAALTAVVEKQLEQLHKGGA